jgi:hypothetical protein
LFSDLENHKELGKNVALETGCLLLHYDVSPGIFVATTKAKRFSNEMRAEIGAVFSMSVVCYLYQVFTKNFENFGKLKKIQNIKKFMKNRPTFFYPVTTWVQVGQTHANEEISYRHFIGFRMRPKTNDTILYLGLSWYDFTSNIFVT